MADFAQKTRKQRSPKANLKTSQYRYYSIKSTNGPPIIMQTTTQILREQNLNILKLVVIDAGNRGVKTISPQGTISLMPSYSIKLDDWQDTPKPCKKSVVLEFEENGTTERYVIGQLAKEFGGQPTFEGDKSALARLMIMSAIAPIGDSRLPLVVEELRIALPDSRYKSDLANLKELESVRTVTRNGVNFTYTIRKVVPIDECVGAYRYAVANDLYRFKSRPNGILDVGGGTTLLKLFSSSGNLLREYDLSLPGTRELANNIAVALLPKIGKSPDLGLIMDGIADNHFLLGTTGINFAKEFESARAKWVAGLRAQINTRWAKGLSTFGEVLIVGGSAPLLKEVEKSTEGRFKIAPNHAFISVKGMALDEETTP